MLPLLLLLLLLLATACCLPPPLLLSLPPSPPVLRLPSSWTSRHCCCWCALAPAAAQAVLPLAALGLKALLSEVPAVKHVAKRAPNAAMVRGGWLVLQLGGWVAGCLRR